jgi:hypothetical protein
MSQNKMEDDKTIEISAKICKICSKNEPDIEMMKNRSVCRNCYNARRRKKHRLMHHSEEDNENKKTVKTEDKVFISKVKIEELTEKIVYIEKENVELKEKNLEFEKAHLKCRDHILELYKIVQQLHEKHEVEIANIRNEFKEIQIK